MSTASVRVFQVVIAGAAAAGIAPPTLCAAAGVDPRALAEPDGRLPRTLEARLWHEAARLTGDEAFGARLAGTLTIDGFGALGYALRSSATLGDAYARLARFLRLMAHGPVLVVARDGRDAIIRHVPPRSGPPAPRHGVEFLLASAVMFARRGVDPEVVPRRARFRHAAPRRLDEHRRWFGPALEFDAAEDALVLDGALLERPQALAEPALAGVLDEHLTRQLAALPTEEASFLERVRAALAAELDDGEPALDAVARRLHMSPRSLQRRLQHEGRSLSQVLDGLRAELARRYLGEARESIGEVAFRLGFSDVSTFHRAFKRWTGETPAAFRRAGGQAQGV